MRRGGGCYLHEMGDLCLPLLCRMGVCTETGGMRRRGEKMCGDARGGHPYRYRGMWMEKSNIGEGTAPAS
jgi:hypothetical protein